VQLEQQGRRYWTDISITFVQHFFSNDDVTERYKVSCALLKHCGTTAGIVRVGYGWKRKCFFTAHWADTP
jgi:hypothetical protein